MTTGRTAIAAALAVLAIALAWVPPTGAAPPRSFETSLQDSAVHSIDPAHTDVALAHMRQAGASWVRIDVSWDQTGAVYVQIRYFDSEASSTQMLTFSVAE